MLSDFGDEESDSVKEVQHLTRRIASFSRFMAASTRKAFPFFSLLKKENTFEWTLEQSSPLFYFFFKLMSDRQLSNYFLVPLPIEKSERNTAILNCIHIEQLTIYYKIRLKYYLTI